MRCMGWVGVPEYLPARARAEQRTLPEKRDACAWVNAYGMRLASVPLFPRLSLSGFSCSLA